ncbi:MAG TPA: zf-HC2 domain-containing protein, partial [Ktedonobacterales bacterium]|nr:zf-HC2 domain-containing protein [Ktedonobacterales bacterium]
MKLLSKRSALHTRAELLIPWLVNGSLPADAEPAVREHVATCPECRQEYEEQLRVREAMRAEGPLVFAAESSYQKLLTRMQSPQADREPRAAPTELDSFRPMPPQRRTPPVVRWLAAAVILQTFAIGLGAWVWHSSSATTGARYVTLASAPPSYDSGPRARVLFRTDLSVGALQTVLQRAGAHIVDGPGDGDVYTLGFAPPPASRAALAKRIAALRADPAVLFAEP